jgi:hypothetical protein
LESCANFSNAIDSDSEAGKAFASSFSAMAKGSQLSQLKSAVAQAGLSRQSQPSKKRKRTPAGETDKDKRANKLKEIHEKLNPFDVKITKLKHDVGGRKLKGVTGKPSKTKQAGLEQVRTAHPRLLSPMAESFAHSARKRCSRNTRNEGM